MHRIFGVLFTVMSLATACGGLTGSAPATQALATSPGTSATVRPALTEVSRPEITITLTSNGCTTEGLGDVLPQHFVATVVNTSSSRVAFNLHMLNLGHTYAELDAWIQARERAIAAGSDIDAAPPMTTIVARANVEAGARGTLEGTLAAATYGVVCRRDSASGNTEAIYVRGPFRVD